MLIGVYNDALSFLHMRISLLTRQLSLRHIVLSLMFCFLAYPGLLLSTIEAATSTEISLRETLRGLQEAWQKNQIEFINSQREYIKGQNRLHMNANEVRRQLCAEGVTEYCPTEVKAKVELQAKNVDLEKLAHAVAVAETGDCTKGTGVSKNNCHGIFGCANGKCGPRHFESKEQSYEEFQKLWITKYGDRFPTIKDARKYTASDGERWLNTVRVVYERP
jgi:hypothetical protein